MNCQDFEPIIIEVARGEEHDDALAHVAACPRCAVRLSNERALSAGLGAVAKEAENAPLDLEDSLLAAFAKQSKKHRIVAPGRIAATVAIAAAIILAIAWNAHRPAIRARAPVADPVYVARPTPAPAQPAAVAPSVPRRKRRQRPLLRAATGVPPQPAAEATEFYPIPYADPLTPVERAEMVRVKMDDRIQADVILGQDGLARAIRFIQSSQ